MLKIDFTQFRVQSLRYYINNRVMAMECLDLHFGINL